MRRLSMLLLCLALSGCTPYSTTVVMRDGSTLQAFPRCTVGEGDERLLVGNDIEEGVPVRDIAKLRSHTGLEPMIIGGVILAGAVALIVHGAKTNTEGWVAVGGAAGGIALIQTVIGAVFLVSSSGSLNRQCSPRSSWGRAPM